MYLSVEGHGNKIQGPRKGKGTPKRTSGQCRRKISRPRSGCGGDPCGVTSRPPDRGTTRPAYGRLLTRPGWNQNESAANAGKRRGFVTGQNTGRKRKPSYSVGQPTVLTPGRRMRQQIRLPTPAPFLTRPPRTLRTARTLGAGASFLLTRDLPRSAREPTLPEPSPDRPLRGTGLSLRVRRVPSSPPQWLMA